MQNEAIQLGMIRAGEGQSGRYSEEWSLSWKLDLEVLAFGLSRLVSYYSPSMFRNRLFQKEDEMFEFFQLTSLFLLFISNVRHGILKVLKKCLLTESVKKIWHLCCLIKREKRIHMITVSLFSTGLYENSSKGV